MIFKLRNVGPVQSADIELGALTIICGKNNTGKTYLTNTIYEFYKYLSNRVSIKVSEKIDPSLSTISVDLENYRQAAYEAIQKQAVAFASSGVIPGGGSMSLDLDASELPLSASASPSTWSSRVMKSLFEVSKKGTQLTFIRKDRVFEGDEKHTDETDRAQWQAILGIVVNAYIFRQEYNNGYIGDAFSMMSERMGVAYFKDCIDIAMRSRVSDESESASGDDVVQKLKNERGVHLFPENVSTMLDLMSSWFHRSRVGIQPQSGYLKSTFRDLENLVGGIYKPDDGRVIFSPLNAGKVELQIQEVSSSVRALFALDMYVRNYAQKGDLLIIDEPEMNLHPEKQRRLARFIAKLVNQGIKVFITTHSDYIIRELNTLMAFSAKNDRMRAIRESEGYSVDEVLNASDVKAYVSRSVEGRIIFDNVELLDDKGVQVVAIDSEIDEMNRIQDRIVWGD